MTILLVEDNPVVQVLTIGLLKGLGYEADLAENGEIAIRMSATTVYDLILMDCQLPNVDGYTAAEIIHRGPNSKATIAAFTAHASQEEIARCKRNGMEHILIKPASLEGLTRLIEAISKRSLNTGPK